MPTRSSRERISSWSAELSAAAVDAAAASVAAAAASADAEAVAACAAAVDHRNEGRGELERRLISSNGQRDATGGARLWRRRRTGVFVPVAAGILPARFFKEGALDVLRDAVTGGGAPAAEAAVRVVLALAARAHRRAVALLARALMPKKALATFA